MHPWLKTLDDALVAEATFARRQHAEWRTRPLHERVEGGVSWADQRVTDVQPDGRRWMAVLRGEQHEGIRAGDRIQLGEDGPRGRVVAMDDLAAEVLLDDEPLQDRVHVHKLHDDRTTRRLREALTFADDHPTPVTRHLLEPEALTEGTPNAWEHLNPSQAHAADVVQTNTVTCIHGPPGTGKTHVVRSLLRRAVEDGHRPWALADSNAAADHLARTASSAGLKVLRAGVPFRIDPALGSTTLAAWLERSPFARALQAIERQLARARSRREGGRTLGPLYDERRQLRRQARRWVYDSLDVLVTTHGSLAGLLVDAEAPARPGLVVVDEATQATEPAIWVCAPHADRLVLVGDPHQLGPVVLSGDRVLATSLLERLLSAVGGPMLEVQHRMHAHIHALVQDTYGPTYRPHGTVAGHTLDDLGVQGFDPVTFVDTAGSGVDHVQDPTTRSLYNIEELRLVQLALQRLLDAGLPPSSIAVATPYSAQARRIRQLSEAQAVRVGSINALQGQEAEAVLVSFVRSGGDGIGFLSDQRRLTVGLTRARRHLWMCGDSATLCRHPAYEALLARCEQEGALTSVWSPPWLA